MRAPSESRCFVLRYLFILPHFDQSMGLPLCFVCSRYYQTMLCHLYFSYEFWALTWMRFLQDLDIVVQFVLTLSLSILCPCLLNTRAAQRLLQSFAAAFRRSPSPAFPLFLTPVVVWSEFHFQAGNSNYHAVAAGAAYLYSPPSASKAAAKRAMIVSKNRAFIFSPGGLCGDGDS